MENTQGTIAEVEPRTLSEAGTHLEGQQAQRECELLQTGA
jgi:hypothetical protein